MTIERIDRDDDPRLAVYHAVRDGELVRSRGLFVAEGRLIVRRVLEDPRYRIHSLLLNDAALLDLDAAIANHDDELTIFVGEPRQLAKTAGYDVHRGCLALVHRPSGTLPTDLIASARLLVILESIANADNVGGIFRNAAAFGADGVLLSPSCCDPLYRKAIRTSMGAALRVPFARATTAEWPRVLDDVRASGITTVALTLRESAQTLDAFAAHNRAARLALLLGAEGAGLSAAVEAAADHRVRIPMTGGVDSLNVAVAAGIALHRLRS